MNHSSTSSVAAPLPAEEPLRVRSLRALDILDTPPEQPFDDLARLAAYVCETPCALISFVDSGREWFKAKVGVEISEVPREISFCAHAIVEDGISIVPDAAEDPRFMNNPLVVRDPKIRFYAGVAIKSAEGFPIGTLCVLDHQRHDLRPDQRAALLALSRQVEHLLLEIRSVAAISLLESVSAVAASAPSLEGAFRAALEGLSVFTGWPLADAFMLDKRSGRFVPTGWWHDVGSGNYEAFRRLTDERSFESGEGLVGRVGLTGRPAWIFDVTRDDNFSRRRAAEESGLSAAAAFPVFSQSYVIAVLELFSPDPQRPDQGLLELMEQIGMLLGRVAERFWAETELRASDERIRRIVETADDPFVAMSREGLVTEWNAKAESSFGWSKAEALGRPLVDLIIPPRYRSAHNSGIQRFLSTGEGPVIGQRIEIEALRRDGKEFPVELSVWPVEVQGDYSFNAFVRDVTDRKLAQQMLEENLDRERRMVEQLKELDEAKSQFVSTVSHELRTPLTSITGYVELLAEGEAGPLEEGQLEMLKVIDRNSRRLLEMIENLLIMSRVQSGVFTPDTRPTRLQSVLESVQAAMAPGAGAKSLEFDVHVTAGLPRVMADPGQLDRALLNLVSNAIKFTPEGGAVTVTAGSRGDKAFVTVGDTGIGIPIEEQRKLFSRFFRSSLASAGAVQGTGLGLVITKSIVESHGGEIWLESAPGAGSRFTFTIPFVSEDQESPDSGPEAEAMEPEPLR